MKGFGLCAAVAVSRMGWDGMEMVFLLLLLLLLPENVEKCQVVCMSVFFSFFLLFFSLFVHCSFATSYCLNCTNVEKKRTQPCKHTDIDLATQKNALSHALLDNLNELIFRSMACRFGIIPTSH